MSQIITLLDSIFQNNGGTTKQWRQANEILLTKTDEIKKYVSYMKNKIRDLNKDTQLLALDFLDYSIDDGKMPLWTQVGSKDFLSSLVNIYKTRTEEEVQTKILFLIKKWANKFQKYNTIIPNFTSTYENLKNNDINFPHGMESTYEKYLQGPENNQGFGNGESKIKKIKNENTSSNKNYVKNINVDLRTSSYEKKYKRLVNKLDEWTQQIEDANVYMDIAQGGNFDDDLRGICEELESGKKQLVDTIESGKLKDEKLMEISLNVQDDIEMTLKRWEDVKNGRNPSTFNSSFFSKSGNNNNKNNDNNNNNNQNKGGLDLLGFDGDDNSNNNNNANKGNDLLDVFSGAQNVNQGNNDFFGNIGNNNQDNNNFFGNNSNQNNNNFFGNNNQNNQNNINFFGDNNNQINNNFFGNSNQNNANQNNNTNFFGNNSQNNLNQNNNFFGNNNNQNNANQNNNNDLFSQMFNNNNTNNMNNNMNNNMSNNNFMNNNNNNNFNNLLQNSNAFNMNNNQFVNLNNNLNNQMNIGNNNNNSFNNFGFNNNNNANTNANNNFNNNNTFNNFNQNNNINNKNKSNKDYVFDFKI